MNEVEQIPIIEYNDAFVVCLKPAGILSQGSPGGKANMVTRLEQQLNRQVFPVHRLDAETTGLMVYACTSQTAAVFSEQIQKKLFHKEYLAVVQGVPTPENGVYEDLLLHDQRKNKSFVVDRKRKGVREARLSYTVLACREGRSLVQVKLFTGRTHQIRVQFASRGNPLYGDRRYGGEKGALCLASTRISFVDPQSGKRCEYTQIPEFAASFDWNQNLLRL